VYVVLVICDTTHVLNVEQQSIISLKLKVFKLHKYYFPRNFQKIWTEKLERMKYVFVIQNVYS
jgi:hypothetical protein